MRVIEQASLWFREGTSDKVYEVDLVEVATSQHVVNFRFGRRGSALKDGTKTATPVALAKAKLVFDKLVAEKVAGGYKHAGGAAVAPAPRPGNGPAATNDSAAIVARLRQGTRGEGSLHAAVWRAGDRDLIEAEPALLELLGAPAPKPTPPWVWTHLVLSALVRCGTSAALPKLRAITEDPKTPMHVRAIGRLAIVRISPAALSLQPSLGDLSPAIGAALVAGDAGTVARAAEEMLATDVPKATAIAVGLYLINDAVTRPAVLALARVARLSNAEIAVIRTLFRMAELRRDGELYVLIARRIDAVTTRAGYSPTSPHSRIPMSPGTRGYFRRRVARVLRRLARARSADYVTMASAVLLAYTDDDGEPPKQAWDHWYDRFARYHALNDILYGKSPRYERAHHYRATWKCKGRYRPGDPAPPVREERYPHLWDAAPEALWRLLGAARALPVLELATKALRANRPFVDALPDDALAAVLATGQSIAQQFAFEMVRDRPMSIALARGALASDLDDAHTWVIRWIVAHVADALKDPELLALLVTGKTAAIRESALTLLLGRALPDDVAKSVAIRSLSILLGFRDAPENNERAAAAAGLLLRVLEAPLKEIGTQVLRDLIRHPLPALGELAGELMLRHAKRDALPGELLEMLLASPHASVRLLGGRLLALTPADLIKDDPEALVLFATSANAELREGTRTLLGEVAQRYPDIGRVIAARLVESLLIPQPDGAPAHIVSLLRAELAHVLPTVEPAKILKLIGALSPHAREAGGLLLSQLGPDDLGIDEIGRLASHEILAIRRGAWALAAAAVHRFQLAPVAVARLVDSAWADTRAFAFAFVREVLKTVNAETIIAICDSIRPEVQAFGKQLLHEQFQAADAGTYLVKLAEHPSANIQLLVSGMLEHHVAPRMEGDGLAPDPAGALARIRVLAPYLITVLSQVNRGRVAKERVIALLRREAAVSVEAATVIAPILDRQSVTIAITQKHPLISTMVDVATTFPAVTLPITIVPPPPHGRER